MIQLPLSALLDALVLAGHTDNISNLPYRGEARGDDDGGIGAGPIVAVIVLAVVTIAMLIWLSSPSTKARLKRMAPLGLFAAIIAAPLALWAATSGGDSEGLVVERFTNDAGKPELLVSLSDDDLNSPEMTKGAKTVRVQCRGRDGQVVVDAKQKWPFINERGYNYPHIHQFVTREQSQRATRCRVQGTHVRLEANVRGAVNR